MSEKSIKVNPLVHQLVDEHTQKVGGKIGKFFELAAKEKLERETKPVSNWPVKKETK
jgi:hypothetical protein